MSQRIKLLVLSLLLVFSLALSFGVGYIAGGSFPAGSGEGISKVVEAWGIIIEKYVAGDEIDVDVLAEAAIRGMMDEVADPHSAYLDPAAYQHSLADFEGQYEGIGAEVTVEDGQIMITVPYAGSPAAEAGIEAGDIILAVDGRSTAEMSLAEVVALVRGPKGTTVRLLVRHQDETEAEEILVVRDEIKEVSVHLEMLGNIAYISISRFTERTSGELEPVLEGLSQQQAAAIILDLRHNPGGLLSAVIDVTSHFLTDGVVLSVVDSDGKREVYEVTSRQVTTALPMVVLVDAFSASGSEVLAGALQDSGRAEVAGTITFGKGSVNQLYQLQDGSGLYLTVARWYTPDGRLIEGQGIEPDYVLELAGDDLVEWAIDYLTGSQ